MEKYLDLNGMETTTHIEIAKQLVHEMTTSEKRSLINYIKSTMKPPQRNSLQQITQFIFLLNNLKKQKYKNLLKDYFLWYNNDPRKIGPKI